MILQPATCNSCGSKVYIETSPDGMTRVLDLGDRINDTVVKIDDEWFHPDLVRRYKFHDPSHMLGAFAAASQLIRTTGAIVVQPKAELPAAQPEPEPVWAEEYVEPDFPEGPMYDDEGREMDKDRWRFYSKARWIGMQEYCNAKECLAKPGEQCKDFSTYGKRMGRLNTWPHVVRFRSYFRALPRDDWYFKYAADHGVFK